MNKRFLTKFFQLLKKMLKNISDFIFNGKFVTFFAAISAVAAAISAYSSYKSAIKTTDSVSLEMAPVILLDCEMGGIGIIQVKFPQPVLFLLPPDGLMVNLLENIPIYNARGEQYKIPPFYNRCSLKNYGRLPALDIVITFKVEFIKSGNGKENTSGAAKVIIPALSPGSSYDFLIANASDIYVRVIPPDTVYMETPISGSSLPYHLFLSRWARALESNSLPPSPLSSSISKLR